MKEHRILDKRDEEAAEQSLFRAILSLRDVGEVRSFLVDLCTPAELQALKDRWLVAELLDRNLPYRQIHDRTGVSVTTIGRVARYLNNGAGGYSKALQRRRK
ncbi:MAG: YerC/YecD family TrpR-related protein [Gammaproteobacteria bacterium]|nr:YerC/YecD family TrpR-related protein [Gammaproteobacteria bacterium]MDH5275907.1 YerC/YecD family TrpR-related protein [Gammaproteobacteria bacterium]